MTRIIIRATPNAGRNDFIRYLKGKLPDAEWCYDQKRDARDTFERAKRMAGADPCVHMEEDVILTKAFREKMEAAIKERPNHVVQFYTMLKDDTEKGARWIGRFSSNLCYYLPAGLSLGVLKYCETWNGWAKHPTGIDLVIEDYRKEGKFKVWAEVPNLVQHRVSKSLLGPRSSKRQSGTFQDPDE